MASSPPAARKWVLVADDDAHVRQLWTRTLAQAGYAVIEARDGLETVSAMRFLLPDFVLLDLHMPHLTGQDVLASIRGSPIVGRIPVLVVSGHLANGPPLQDLGLNIVGRLPKPVDVADLLRAVRAALQPAHGLGGAMGPEAAAPAG